MMEFPWLWAIKQRWNESYSVAVSQLPVFYFKYGSQGFNTEGLSAWVISEFDGTQSIDPVDFTVDRQYLTDYMFAALPNSNFRIKYYAREYSDIPLVDILRMPQGFDEAMVQNCTRG